MHPSCYISVLEAESRVSHSFKAVYSQNLCMLTEAGWSRVFSTWGSTGTVHRRKGNRISIPNVQANKYRQTRNWTHLLSYRSHGTICSRHQMRNRYEGAARWTPCVTKSPCQRAERGKEQETKHHQSVTWTDDLIHILMHQISNSNKVMRKWTHEYM